MHYFLSLQIRRRRVEQRLRGATGGRLDGAAGGAAGQRRDVLAGLRTYRRSAVR